MKKLLKDRSKTNPRTSQYFVQDTQQSSNDITVPSTSSFIPNSNTNQQQAVNSQPV